MTEAQGRGCPWASTSGRNLLHPGLIRAAILAAALALTGLLSHLTALAEVPAWPSLATFEMFLSHSIPPPVEVHAWNYADHDLTCLSWTDGCVSCEGGGGAPTPGWLCQRSEVRCTKREP